MSISIIESHLNGSGAMYIKGACLSTDTKPSGVAVGSEMVEADTGTTYLYDGSDWQAPQSAATDAEV